ncbi:MAG: lipid-A-disaccharide synthase [Aureispira sp.]
MKYYIVAGEASGDLHGSYLVKALIDGDQEAVLRGWGGDLMEQAGMTLVQHYREMAYMGVWQVLKHLPSILGKLKACKADIQQFQPDALILIDYSGFNLRLAPWAKKQGFKIYYYISPQVWATRAKRVQTIRQSVDHVFSILPFEKAFYEQYHYSLTYVGHPLLDVVADHQPQPNFRATWNLDQRPIIALLPGSRRQEIRSMLPAMLGVVEYFPAYQFVVAAAPSIEPSFYEQYLATIPNVLLIRQQTYDILQHSHAAFVTSGTATLEAALFNVPQVVCYKAGPLMYAIAKRLIKVRFIALVNLIMDQEIVPERIQKEVSPEHLKVTLAPLLEGPQRAAILAAYDQLRQHLGVPGAAKRTAAHLQERLHLLPPSSKDL